MMFRKENGKVNFTSLVERVSRFAVAMRNEDRHSEPIMEAPITSLAFPSPPRCPVDHLGPQYRIVCQTTADDGIAAAS